jgi:cell filamentation protein
MVHEWMATGELGRKLGIKAKEAEALCVAGGCEGTINVGGKRLAPRPSGNSPGKGKNPPNRLDVESARDRIERLVADVDGTMAIEDLALSDEGKDLLRSVLRGECATGETLQMLVGKHERTVGPNGCAETRNRRAEYNANDMYCLKDRPVLRNKLNIEESEALADAERDIVSLRIFEAQQSPIRGRLGFYHLRAITRRILGDVYDWAGFLRLVDISKGNQFCLWRVVNTFCVELFEKLAAERFLIDTPKDLFAERIARYFNLINLTHPFREGNGRTQRLFIEYLALVAGYRISFAGVSAGEMIEACILGYNRDESLLRDLFERIAVPISESEQKTAILKLCGASSAQMGFFGKKDSGCETRRFAATSDWK